MRSMSSSSEMLVHERQLHHGPVELKGSMNTWRAVTAELVSVGESAAGDSNHRIGRERTKIAIKVYKSDFAFESAGSMPQAQFELSSRPLAVLDDEAGHRRHRFEIGVQDRAPLRLAAPSFEALQQWKQAHETAQTILSEVAAQSASIQADFNDDNDFEDFEERGAAAVGSTFVSHSTLRFGDQILLQCGKGGAATVHGDGLCRTRVGAACERLMRRQREQCVFLVCPALRYDANDTDMEHLATLTPEATQPQLNEAEGTSHRQNKAGRSSFYVALAAKQEQEAGTWQALQAANEAPRMTRQEQQRHNRQREKEIQRQRKMNNTIVKGLATESPGVVKFGEVVQLQHVRSGKFVTICEDSTALQLVEHGTAGSQFFVRPKYSGRNEGGRVHIHDYMMLESVAVPGRYMRTNLQFEAGWDAIVNFDEDDGMQERMSKQEMRIYEVVAASATDEDNLATWKMVDHAKPYRSEFDGLCANEPFRLFHPHQRSFITAYTGWRLNPIYLTDDIEGLGSAFAQEQDAVQHAAHMPYMRQILEGGDAAQTMQQSSADVWVFESLSDSHAGVVRFRTPLRIKHLPTRKYLGRETCKGQSRGNSKSNSDEYRLKLWAAPDKSHEESFDHHCTFEVWPDELTDNEVLRTGTILSLRIANIKHDREGHASKQYLHLHVSSATDFGCPPKDIADSFAGVDNDEPVEARLRRLVLSARVEPEDTIQLMPASASEARQIESIRTCKGIARLYESTVLSTIPQNGRSSVSANLGIVNPSMKMILSDAHTMLCLVVSLVAKLGASSATKQHDILDLTMQLSRPNKDAQNMVKDLGLLSGLFAMIQAVVNASKHYRRHPGGAAEHALGNLHCVGAAEPQLIIHKGVFATLQKCFDHNKAVQCYFGQQRILIPSMPDDPHDLMYDTFIRATIRQVGTTYDVGAALCLKELITDNKKLLFGNTRLGASTTRSGKSKSKTGEIEKASNHDEITELIKLIVRLIKQNGRSAVLLEFLSTTCCCHGAGIAKNQRVCLDELLKCDDGAIFIETHAFVNHSQALPVKIMDELAASWKDPFIENTEPDRMFCYGLAYRQAYEAKNREVTAQNQLPRIYVRWPALGENTTDILTCGLDKWQEQTLLPPSKAETKELHMDVTLSRDDVVHTSTSGELGAQHESTYDIGKQYYFDIQPEEAVPNVLEAGRRLCQVLAICRDHDVPGSTIYSGTLIVRPLEPEPPATQWLPLEHLCWILDPYFMCYQVWPCKEFDSRKQVDDRLMANTELDARVQAHTELARYYVAQIDLFSNLCRDRNYHAIEYLSRVFPFETLISAAVNTGLPFRLRSAFVGLMQRLHVDRYPQVKLRIPTLVHPPPCSLKTAQSDFIVFTPPIDGDTPLRVHALERKRVAFQLACGDTKFRLLRDIIEHYFERAYGSSDAASDITWRFRNVERDNRHGFTMQVTELLESLITFGFYSNVQKIQPLVKQLVAALDGRRDHISKMGHKPTRKECAGADYSPHEYISESGLCYDWVGWHERGRYMRDGEGSHPKSIVMMHMRARICDVLLQFGNLRADYRVRLFVRTHGSNFDNDKSCTRNLLGSGEESLFGSNNSNCFDLSKTANKPLDRILLDLLMYDSPDLFRSAFALLVRRYGQKSNFVKAINAVVFFDMEHKSGIVEEDANSGQYTGDEQKHQETVAQNASDLGSGQLLKRLRQLVVDAKLKVNLWPFTNDVGNNLYDAESARQKNARALQLLRRLECYADHRTNSSLVLQALRAHDVFLAGISHVPIDDADTIKAWHDLVAQCLCCLENMVRVVDGGEQVNLANFLFARLDKFIQLIFTSMRFVGQSSIMTRCMEVLCAIIKCSPTHCKDAFVKLEDVLDHVINSMPVGAEPTQQGCRKAILQLLSVLVCPNMQDKDDDGKPWCCQRNQEPVFKLVERAVQRLCGNAKSNAGWHTVLDTRATNLIADHDMMSILEVSLVCSISNTSVREMVSAPNRCGDVDFRRIVMQALLDELGRFDAKVLEGTTHSIRWKSLTTLLLLVHHVYFATTVVPEGMHDTQLLTLIISALVVVANFQPNDDDSRDFRNFISCAEHMTQHVATLAQKSSGGSQKDLVKLKSALTETMLTLGFQKHAAVPSTQSHVRHLGSRKESRGKMRHRASGSRRSRGRSPHGRSSRTRGSSFGSMNSGSQWDVDKSTFLGATLARYKRKCKQVTAHLAGAQKIEFDTLVDIIQNASLVTFKEGLLQQHGVLVSAFDGITHGLKELTHTSADTDRATADRDRLVRCLPDPVPGHGGVHPVHNTTQPRSLRRRINFDELVHRLCLAVGRRLDLAAEGSGLDQGSYDAVTNIFNIFRRYIGQYRPIEQEEHSRSAGLTRTQITESLGQAAIEIKLLTGLGHTRLEPLDENGNMTRVELRKAQYNSSNYLSLAQKYETMKEAQNTLLEQGCMQLMVSAIIASNHNDQEELLDAQTYMFWSALHFGTVMLERGNSKVQEDLLRILQDERICAEFLESIWLRLCDQVHELQWRFDSPTEDSPNDPWYWHWQEGGYESILHFLQVCCEGHNRDMQTLVHRQSNVAKSINFVTDVQRFLRQFVPSMRDVYGNYDRDGNLRHLDGDSRRRLLAIIASETFLTEAMEGPCRENQALVAVPGMPEMIKTIILATNATALRMSGDEQKNFDVEDSGLFAKLGAATMKMASAMLEGTSTLAPVKRMFRESIGALAFSKRVERLHDRLETLHMAQVDHAGAAHKEAGVALDEAFDLFAVTKALSTNDENWLEHATTGHMYAGFKLAYEELARRFGTVEVAWNDSIHQIFFQLPRESNRLDDIAKKRVDEKIDLGGGRLNEFLSTCRQLSAELLAMETLSQSQVAGVFKRHFAQIKYALYGQVVLLNWLILSSIKAEHNDGWVQVGNHSDTDINTQNAFKTFQRRDYQFGEHITYTTSTQATLAGVSTLISGVGYFILSAYLIISQWPLVCQRHRDERARQKQANERKTQRKKDLEEAREQLSTRWRADIFAANRQLAGSGKTGKRISRHIHISRRGSWTFGARSASSNKPKRHRKFVVQCCLDRWGNKWGDWSAFKAPFFGTSFCFLLWAITLTHERSWVDVRYFWILSGFAVLLLSTLNGLRTFWGNRMWNKQAGGPAEMYCKLYDVITHPQVIVHLLLCIVSFLAFSSYRFAPLLLMDIATFNKTLNNVVIAAVKPYKELLMTLALALIVIFIYTSFGMYSFGDDFRAEDDGSGLVTTVCPDLLRCYANMLMHGIKNPEELQMDVLTHYDEDWAGYLFFNLTFFLIMGTLLLNMVTGVIVDTFSALRLDAADRYYKLNNMCFICGIQRAEMEALGATHDFDEHVSCDHERWSYFYFLHYLWHLRDPMEFNGVETYVDRCVKERKTDWLPNRRWVKLQNMEQRQDDAEQQKSTEIKIQQLAEKVDAMAQLQERDMRTLSEQQERIEAVLRRLQSKM